MDDKTLLELAAKAAGIAIDDWSYNDDPVFLVEHWSGDPNEYPEQEVLYWNPLKYEHDAFRLAIDLKINFTVIGNDAIALGKTQCNERIKDDPYAATRRAIVRAAAAIGETM